MFHLHTKTNISKLSYILYTFIKVHLPSLALVPFKPLYLCTPFIKAALVKDNFKTIVILSTHVDIMEWVAVNDVLLLAICLLCPSF